MQCNKCGNEREVTDFVFKDKQAGKRHTVCKFCQREYKLKHYRQNASYYISKSKEWKRNRQAVAHKYIVEYFAIHHCVDCGEDDPVILDFDHKDPTVKEGNICTMVKDCVPLELIVQEIDKCEVRCANCHRRKTAQAGQYWKSRTSE